MHRIWRLINFGSNGERIDEDVLGLGFEKMVDSQAIYELLNPGEVFV